MGRFVLRRLLTGILAVMVVVLVVMALIYGGMDRNLVFAEDPVYSRRQHNAKEIYRYSQWERFGYVDFVSYEEFLTQQGLAYTPIGDTPGQDSPQAHEQVAQFVGKYQDLGYQVVRLPGVYKIGTKRYQDGGEPRLFAYRDVPLLKRMASFLGNLVNIDTVNKVDGVEDRGLTFTWYDPAYGGDTFAPAILGNGTYHRYLLYFDGEFPFIHQNFITLNLGLSYSVNQGVDALSTMTDAQGAYRYDTVHYPTGLTEVSADDLHSAVWSAGSLAQGGQGLQSRFDSDYTAVKTNKTGLSRLGYSFRIGLLAVAIAYLTAIPFGTFMAMKRQGLGDRLGTGYIVFMTAVPSLGYIFLVKAIGANLGLPVVFSVDQPSFSQYLLPAVCLALGTGAGLMKWHRRYMLDQLSAEYVHFATAQGFSKWQILWRQVAKNAAVPLLHGLPASILGAFAGAIITERVFVVPGAGNLLTRAIGQYDNGVIVGVTAFYALLGMVGTLAGDVLLGILDPRVRMEG